MGIVRFFRRSGRVQAFARALLCAWLLAAAVPAEVRAQNVRADVDASTRHGYARLIFSFSEQIRPQVHTADSILIVAFPQPVEVAVDGVARRLPDYVIAGRRDPDGTAVRFALGARVRANVMEAGDKLFVDLLPPGWVGLPPGLPQDVVDDLARRAREAEQRARENLARTPAAPIAPIQLRLSSAPTFVRFAFELPQPILINVEREGQEMRLVFHAPARVDLGDARTQLPRGVVGLETEFGDRSSIVKIVLAPDATAREFREQNAFLVDVTPPPIETAAPTFEDLAAEFEAGRKAVASGVPAIAPPPQQAPADKTEAEPPAAVVVVAPAAPAQNPMPPLADTGDSDHWAAPLDMTTGPQTSQSGLVPVISRISGQLGIAFPFPEPVNSAVFVRGDALWVAFDSPRPINAAPIVAEATNTVLDAEYLRTDAGGALRIELARPRLPGVVRDGNTWTVTLGDGMAAPGRPLPLRRMAESADAAAIMVPLEGPGRVHTLTDPEVGDEMIVVTAGPPARGVLRGQDFVEFRALPSVHGLALARRADDLVAAPTADGVILRRPAGLELSEIPLLPAAQRTGEARDATPLDPVLWATEADQVYEAREAELMNAVVATPPGLRADARIMLARFYLSQGFATEARATLEAGMREGKDVLSRPLYYLLRGIAELELGRPDQALRNLADGNISATGEAALMRAVALAGLSRWSQAREAARAGMSAFDNIPPGFQRAVLFAALRASIEVRDFIEASRLQNELETRDIPDGEKPEFALLTGRVAEGIGRYERAHALYRAAAQPDDGPAAAEAQLRSLDMRQARGEIARSKAIAALETLGMRWRGDRIELETLRLLGRLYVADSRYRQAFRALDAATLIESDSDITRAFHAEMATVFEDLYLTGKSETLPPVEALALYYDFSPLTPIGRRGDELIRRLADRLVSVDLLDQATELLDHQVEYRLTGAARAQVAIKLALVHLLNHKPADAVRTLVATRMPGLPNELREQRLLVEARALSDTGRHATALELIQHLSGPEVERLRADIAWAAKDWRAAGEQLEKLLGDRWKNEPELAEEERHDVLRAALAYSVGDEGLGLARLRDKFGEKMGGTPEGAVLSLLASPEGTSATTMSEAAKALANFDSLRTFLKLYRQRYPDGPLPPDPAPTGSLRHSAVR